ncbi:MAG: aminotransferase class I/II-fold pyridoxal phosphate-dependent enzyme [Actinomycetota bacterium]
MTEIPHPYQTAYVPPPYPYDLLDELRAIASERFGTAIDCSIGAPIDPPPASVIAALSNSDAERGYPPSIGTRAYRDAAARWMERITGVSVDPTSQIGAVVGTKEFVAGTPHYLRMRTPARDTVLFPEVAYPSYEQGAIFSGCRAVAVPVDDQWRLDLDAIDPADASRALCLWVNTPGNPAGGLDDLEAVAAWGRANDVLVLSDECYIEFTWDGPPRSILQHGSEGVVAVHSLSKRSNLAGGRAGFYAGDTDVVHYLREIRKHGGMMVPGPVQAAAIAAFDDTAHVDEQRAIYRARLEVGLELMRAAGATVELPGGGFYLWASAPDGDAWGLARVLAEQAGVIVSPGEFYGRRTDHVRFAAVQSLDDLRRAAGRLGVS